MDCHVSSNVEVVPGNGTVALVGQPNVGKSVLFQRITGSHAIVSNYPGTTVEVTRGQARLLPNTVVLDTPGVITFPPHTEDERVTERVLLQEPLKAVLQVGDAKNLRRTLLLTVQLAEMGLPLVLSLNMMDEANARGVVVDHTVISDSLSLPVIPITAIRGEGIEELTKAVQSAPSSSIHINYPNEIEFALADICAYLPDAPISHRALALLWLSGDSVIAEWLQHRLDSNDLDKIAARRLILQEALGKLPSDVIQVSRLDYVQGVVNAALVDAGTGWGGTSKTVEHLMIHPLWGLPILA
ncbi:MAG: 50S ribosome-binding GTPase, partial [Anaerolineales bacterium]|nr:50S ribosome-binding GTPase [Anaerolineales bacterium]